MLDPEEDRLRSCAYKSIYFSELEAREAIEETSLFGPTNIEPYPCRYCPWWHVGQWRNYSSVPESRRFRRASSSKRSLALRG